MKMSKTKIAITLGILCFILTLAISVQIKTMKAADSVVSTTTANNELKNQVLIWKEKYEKALEEYEKLEIDLEQVRNNATQNDSEATKMLESIKQNNKLIGITDVTGDGIVIVLQDTLAVEDVNVGIPVENYLVHDSDLKTLINELWNAGAEAISINGQRITSITSIVCDGNIIRINGETTTSPFEIKAIGAGLYGAIARPGGYYEFMGQTGVTTSIRTQNNIKIPKYTGAISSQYIKTK